MPGLSTFGAFLTDESGAVTVDYVVITAACIGMGFWTTNVISSGLHELSHNVKAQVETDYLRTSFDPVEEDPNPSGGSDDDDDDDD